MMKFIHKKATQEETPYLLLERRHTLKDLSHVLDDFDPKRVERCNSVGSATSFKKAAVVRVHSRSESDRRPPIPDKPKLHSSPSTIIVTENELAASKLFLDKRALIKPDESVSDATSNTSNETVTDSRPMVPSNLIAKSVLTEKSRPKKITCCCYAAIVALIFLATLVIMAAICGVVYMELFVKHNETIIERIKEVYIVKDEFVKSARSRGKFVRTEAPDHESYSLADSMPSGEGSLPLLREGLPVKERDSSKRRNQNENIDLEKDPKVSLKGDFERERVGNFNLNSEDRFSDSQSNGQNSGISKLGIADLSEKSTNETEVTSLSSKHSAEVKNASMELPEVSKSADHSEDNIENDLNTPSAEEGNSNEFDADDDTELKLQNDDGVSVPSVSFTADGNPNQFDIDDDDDTDVQLLSDDQSDVSVTNQTPDFENWSEVVDDDSLQPVDENSEEDSVEQLMPETKDRNSDDTLEEISSNGNSLSEGEPVPESVLFHPVVESKAVPVPLDFLRRIGFEIKNLNPHQKLTAQDMDVKFSLAEALIFLRSLDENNTLPVSGPTIQTTARSARSPATKRKIEVKDVMGEQADYLYRLRHIMYD